MKQKLIMCRGLPASGKTTWAKEQIEKSNGKIKRVNKDDLRAMIDFGKYSKERESNVLQIRDFIIKHYLSEGYSIIVDDTNLAEQHEKRFTEIVNDLNYNKQYLRNGGNNTTPLIEFEIKDFTDIPVEECIERDSKRGNKSVGIKVIADMYRQYLYRKPDLIPFNSNLDDCIIVDVDGTLCLNYYRNPFKYKDAINDEPRIEVINLISMIKNFYTLKIFIFTGRENVQYEDETCVKDITEQWLNKHNVPYDVIEIRQEGDYRADNIVKREMYEKHIKDKYNVLYVLDDRKQMIDEWRKLGLFVLDVAGHIF